MAKYELVIKVGFCTDFIKSVLSINRAGSIKPKATASIRKVTDQYYNEFYFPGDVK